MRQGQQNRRGRGRTNRSKGQSPLTRSFESNGPDVKIRGTPAHIGEKYLSLARDASASGDPVLAENYFQHAEHYNRIIMAVREQFAQQDGGDLTNGTGRHRSGQEAGLMEGGDEYGGEDDGDDYPGDSQPTMRSNEPEPRSFERNQRQEERPYRQGPEYNRSSRERQGPATRGPAHERRPHSEQQSHTSKDEQPGESFSPPARQEGNSRRRERYPLQQHEQPEFLRRPVRRPGRDANGVEPGGDPHGPAPGTPDDDTQD